MPAHADDKETREWFAVQVRSGRERWSARHLEQRGYEVFLPRYREYRQRSDRIAAVERALFAGYVFCRVPPIVFGKIVTTPGVIRIVGDGAGPSAIPAHEIEPIQRIVEMRLTTEPSAIPQIGERVRIARGPLQGVDGIVVTVKDTQHLILSVTLLQRAVAVAIPAGWIAFAQCQSPA